MRLLYQLYTLVCYGSLSLMLNAKSLLLILSFNQRNLELLTQVLEKAGYKVIAVENYEKLEQVIHNFPMIDLALIDLVGCDRRIWNYCEQLKILNIPFLNFTSQYNCILEQHSLTHGARSVLVKPLVIKNLLLLIHRLVGKN